MSKKGQSMQKTMSAGGDKHNWFDATKEIRIVLVGKTGCGKSSTGNTILGRDEFRRNSGFQSGTSECKASTCEYAGYKLLVVDTPGLHDSAVPDETTVTEISRCLALASPGPHVFLWVIKANDRFSNRDTDVSGIIDLMFGDNVKRYVILVFTHFDQVEGDFNEKLRNAPDDLQNILQAVEHRLVAFSNTPANRKASLEELMTNVVELASSRRVHFSNKMTQNIEFHVQERLRDIENTHRINPEAARAQLRERLQTGQENPLITLLFSVVGAFIGGAAGSFATPIGTAAGAGVGATVGASVGFFLRKYCSIL